MVESRRNLTSLNEYRKSIGRNSFVVVSAPFVYCVQPMSDIFAMRLVIRLHGLHCSNAIRESSRDSNLGLLVVNNTSACQKDISFNDTSIQAKHYLFALSTVEEIHQAR